MTDKKKIIKGIEAILSVADDIEAGKLQTGVGECFKLGLPCCAMGHVAYRATGGDYNYNVTSARALEKALGAGFDVYESDLHGLASEVALINDDRDRRDNVNLVAALRGLANEVAAELL